MQTVGKAVVLSTSGCFPFCLLGAITSPTDEAFGSSCWLIRV